jgi:hypothetical protein
LRLMVKARIATSIGERNGRRNSSPVMLST